MKFLIKNKGVIIFYLIILVSTLISINVSPDKQMTNNNSNLFVQK